MERAIDVRFLQKECEECPRRNLKELTLACSECMCKLLEDKMKTEKRAYAEWEKKQKEKSNQF